MRTSALRIDDALDLIADAQAAACGMDPRHRIVYWNDSATALLGWTSREVLGKKCYDVFAGRDVFGNLCCFRDCGVAVASSRGEAPAPFVMDVRTREGTAARLVTRTIALPSPGAAYRTLIHIFENGDGASLDAVLARVTSVVATPAEPVAGPPEERITLSPREQQILELLAGGFGSINIAARLGLSHATVRNHVQHLLRRLGVHSQVEAVSLAFRRGMLGRDEAGGDGRSRTDA
ncbi:MAG TPA: LuxR C-terminal-related transcriptional regulator [Thermoanaerobaculia bacterium]